MKKFNVQLSSGYSWDRTPAYIVNLESTEVHTAFQMLADLTGRVIRVTVFREQCDPCLQSAYDYFYPKELKENSIQRIVIDSLNKLA